MIGILVYVKVNDSSHSLQKDILDYQVEYQNFIDKADLIDVDKSNDNSTLARAFQELKRKTEQKTAQIYKKEKELYSFLKVENTTHYQEKNRKAYSDLISENDRLIEDLDNQIKAAPLIKFQENNKKLKEIAQKELKGDKASTDAFSDVVFNRDRVYTARMQ